MTINVYMGTKGLNHCDVRIISSRNRYVCWFSRGYVQIINSLKFVCRSGLVPKHIKLPTLRIPLKYVNDIWAGVQSDNIFSKLKHVE